MTLAQESQLIAVVGMACRFPGARDTDEYWNALMKGTTSLVPLTADELAAKGVPQEVLADPSYVPVAGALEDVEMFDAAYFGIPPAEAAAMDPQHRLFLQEAVHALEHAGWAGSEDRRVGVFCGSGENRYAALLPSPDSGTRTHRSMSDAPAALPLRVSYHLDLRGPSVFVSSLCSTSLTAVHLARRSLLAGECELALAGAVSVQLPQHHGYRALDGSVMSPDGRLRPFDSAAAGTVPGSGVGIVVLKRLDDALRDGDTVHAVIRGSALNNDGADRQSFAAPSVRGQRDVVIAALTDAGVDPATVGYVEAHGTGTSLGDPVELAALREARERLGATTPCAIGAVKSSLGHLDTAAGMAGLIKAVLAVREGTVPATVGHDELNPLIDLGDSGLYINADAGPWPRTEHPRRAAVTALGVGGTNAHLVLEQPPTQPAPSGPAAPDEPHIFPLSAHTPRSFDLLCDRLAETLDHKEHAPGDVARTLQEGRHHRTLRRAWVFPSLQGIGTALREKPVPAPEEGLVLAIDLGDENPYPLDERLGERIPELRRALEHTGSGASRAVVAAHTARGLLDALAVRGVVPDAVAAVGAGEYLAFAHAGALPWAVALRCAERHSRALEASLPGGDLSVCERLLDEIERDLAACPAAPLSVEVRSLTSGTGFPAGRVLPTGHLPAMTRAAVTGEGDFAPPPGCPSLLDGATGWEQWLRLVAHCWERGADVSWHLLRGTGRRIPLPGYPFDEARHWAAPAPDATAAPTPAPPRRAAATAATTPRAGGARDVLTELGAIWRTVLGVPEVAPEDSFFDLGGHSLLASQVMTRIRELFEVRIPLGELLDAETLEGMSELVQDELAALRVYATQTAPTDEAMETVEL
ncbi:beta-ketoacyl synthase N-terminal-like domain-containing protein [Streptomyces milbemycinicus]|uniref:beta-ketoacyl synthase N-terminal-like domain-containing protein n=1 Tax=Streptomyces milbemycinicus TaxID=476552 RepID=UPI0033E96EB1